MLKRILMGALGLVVLAALFSQFLPSRWSVTRSTVINAPAAKIRPYLISFKGGWDKWSAFDNDDPNIQYSHPNPKPGVGCQRSWVSEKMGNGIQTITAVAPNRVDFDLVMPDYDMKLNGFFILEEQGKSTKVTWTDEGNSSRHPLYRIMAQFMDQMMGPVFEESLAKLKGLVEARKK